MKKLQGRGVTSVGVCFMLVGLQICREVIFQVIKGIFRLPLYFRYLSRNHTSFVYNYTTYLLLTKRERGSSPPGRFQTIICSKVSDQRYSKHQGHPTDPFGKLSVRKALNPLQFTKGNFHHELS